MRIVMGEDPQNKSGYFTVDGNLHKNTMRLYIYDCEMTQCISTRLDKSIQNYDSFRSKSQSFRKSSFNHISRTYVPPGFGELIYWTLSGVKVILDVECESNVSIFFKRILRTDISTPAVKLFLSWQWRHNGLDSVLSHQPYHCLLSRIFGRRSKKTKSSATLAFVWGIHRWPVNSPHKWPVKRIMYPFDDVIMCFCRPEFQWMVLNS